MKVLDLQCSQGHSFEGWFGSQDDYDSQRAQGLLTCPVCNDRDILKMLSAPRLNLGHGMAPTLSAGQGDVASSAASSQTRPVSSHQGVDDASADSHGTPDTLRHMQAAMMNMVRHVMANTEDVGPQFAEEARKIHYGEREERNIRGQATREETEALIEEGIEVMPLPIPENLKGPLQ